MLSLNPRARKTKQTEYTSPVPNSSALKIHNQIYTKMNAYIQVIQSQYLEYLVFYPIRNAVSILTYQHCAYYRSNSHREK